MKHIDARIGSYLRVDADLASSRGCFDGAQVQASEDPESRLRNPSRRSPQISKRQRSPNEMSASCI